MHTAMSLKKDGPNVSKIGHRPFDNFFADYGKYYIIRDKRSLFCIINGFRCRNLFGR